MGDDEKKSKIKLESITHDDIIDLCNLTINHKNH